MSELIRCLFSAKHSTFVNNVFQRKVVTFLLNCFIDVVMNLCTVQVRFCINLSHPEQPLLHAKQLFNLHNLLHDRLRETTGYYCSSFRTSILYCFMNIQAPLYEDITMLPSVKILKYLKVLKLF
jgi:hypothetical protein